MAKVSLISLGCPKNLVDSEGALGEIIRAGHQLIGDSSDADVVVINTCGFIESARAESVDTISEIVEMKRDGKPKVVVIGCLSQRFGEELAAAEEGLDAVLGVGHAGRLASTIETVLAGNNLIDTCELSRDWVEPEHRIRSTPPWTAYLKISDGCDNRCAYCAIPDIRGPFRSRPEEYILDEARRLAEDGVKEVVLVGQDLTKYGEDNGGTGSLAGLIRKLDQVDGLRWIRLMYCYPTRITPELISAFSECEKVIKYMDIPLQHGDDRILGAMNRCGTADDYLKVIDSIREKCPQVALRSSFIVGFPGETEVEFKNLVRFVEKIRFDRVGVFVYSQEEGTPAAAFDGHVDEETKHDRFHRLMVVQQDISLEKNEAFVGRRLQVIVEGEEDGVAFGRSYRDAPEIDGVVYITGGSPTPGELIHVEITEADEYDLTGAVCDG